jgi:hypothetical protein
MRNENTWLIEGVGNDGDFRVLAHYVHVELPIHGAAHVSVQAAQRCLISPRNKAYSLGKSIDIRLYIVIFVHKVQARYSYLPKKSISTLLDLYKLNEIRSKQG